MNKIKAIIRCRKGIETAPFFLIFSAIVMIITLVIVMPALFRWWDMLEKQRAIHETEKLVETIHNVHLMGDLGTIEKVDLNLPTTYYVWVLENEDRIELKRGGEIIRIYPLEEEIEYIDDGPGGGRTISGYSVITVYYSKEDMDKSGRKYIIQVKGYKE